jgi:hypothetical protein
MKKLMLLVAVAISIVGYAQEVETPNLKIKTLSYKTYQTVDYVKVDSTWEEYDSLVQAISKCQAEVYGYEDTTTGYYNYDYDPINKLFGSKKRKETFKFDFEKSTLTRLSLTGRKVEQMSSFFELFGSPGECNVYVVNRDGYERLYNVNLTTHTISSVVYVNPKESIGLTNLGDRVYEVSEFSVRPKKLK